MLEAFVERFKDDVELVAHRFADGTVKIIPHWRHVHPPVRNPSEDLRASFTPLERVALAVTVRVGSPGFILKILDHLKDGTDASARSRGEA